MTLREAPTRGEGIVAYALSALTTLLWVGCVLPAGHVAGASAGGDASTPVDRDAILLVPGLLLLVIVPVGCTLALRRHGLRAVLASMDAFVACYVAIALCAVGFVGDTTSVVAVAALFLLGALAVFELIWHSGARAAEGQESSLAGARLALALVVLILPLHILMHPEVERASLLVPFFFVAVSAGGSRIARGMRGLRRTAAVLQLLLAVHLLIALQYTIVRTEPAIESLYFSGKATLGLSLLIVFIALVQLLLYFRRGPEPDLEAASASSPAGSVTPGSSQATIGTP